MLSGGWLRRSQAMTRYQPSPNGAMKQKKSPAVPTVTTSGGGSARRTSASITDRSTDWPGNGIPSVSRTVLCIPSAPTSQPARTSRSAPSGSRTWTSTASSRLVKPVTSLP